MVNRFFPAAVVLPLLFVVPAPLCAKWKTARIEINSANLKRPVEITDPSILAHFNVWTGPGTSSSESKSLIVDWSSGAIAPPPKGLPLYEVSFYANLEKQEEKLVYIVLYGYDPLSRHGYVYLPGKEDKCWWHLNVSSIVRGLEGQWFSAWSAWEDVARPLIEKAKV